MACLGLLSVFVYSIAIYYQKRHSNLSYLDWDVQTITPGDYSLQYEITDEAYQWFLDNVYNNSEDAANGKSTALSLKDYMKKELELLLT